MRTTRSLVILTTLLTMLATLFAASPATAADGTPAASRTTSAWLRETLQVDTADLALALKGVSEAVKTKITSNLSARAAENLLEEVELLGAVRLAQVEEAQQAVIRTIRQLEEQGQIMVRRGNEDEFVV